MLREKVMNRHSSLSVQLFKFGVFLLPYDSMRYLMPSTSYAPISIYVFLLSILVSVILGEGKLKVSKSCILVFVFIVYSILLSTFTSQVYIGSFRFYRNYVLTMILGVITFFSTDNAMRIMSKKQSQENFIDTIFVVLGKAYIIPLIVGTFEIMAMYGVLPLGVKTVLNSVFGGYQTRLCMTTSEASWVSMHMLIAMASYFYLFRAKKSKRYLMQLLMSVFFFFASFSTQGIFTLFIAAFVFVVLQNHMNNSLKALFKNVFVATLLCGLVFVIFYNVLKLFPNTYFASRILNYTSLADLFVSDSSTFIRIGFLIIHLLIFKDHFLFGIGGGSFRFVVFDYIYKYFPKSIGLTEVTNHLIMGDASTSVSIYFSVLSESGVIGTFIFAAMLASVLKKVKYLKHSNNVRGVLILFAVLLALPIQFGSWAFVPFWLGLAFINNLRREI